MAAVSFGVLFTCGLIYDTPPEPTDEELDDEDFDNEDFEDEDNEEEEDDDEKMNDLNQFYYFHETIWKNKPLLVFLLSTYLLNFGYYVPYVHLVSFYFVVSNPLSAKDEITRLKASKHCKAHSAHRRKGQSR